MPKTSKIYKNRPGGKAFKVKAKEDGRFRTGLVTSKNSKKAASKRRGRILSSSKVSMEELLGVGSFFKLGDQLMKEFEEERQNDKSKREVFNGTEGNTREGNTGEPREGYT